jgi:hypothetical protein
MDLAQPTKAPRRPGHPLWLMVQNVSHVLIDSHIPTLGPLNIVMALATVTKEFLLNFVWLLLSFGNSVKGSIKEASWFTEYDKRTGEPFPRSWKRIPRPRLPSVLLTPSMCATLRNFVHLTSTSFVHDLSELLHNHYTYIKIKFKSRSIHHLALSIGQLCGAASHHCAPRDSRFDEPSSQHRLSQSGNSKRKFLPADRLIAPFGCSLDLPLLRWLSGW